MDEVVADWIARARCELDRLFEGPLHPPIVCLQSHSPKQVDEPSAHRDPEVEACMEEQKECFGAAAWWLDATDTGEDTVELSRREVGSTPLDQSSQRPGHDGHGLESVFPTRRRF